MGKIARYLNQLTIGNVFDSADVLDAYSTDRSVLKIRPRLVALPESTDDIRRLMRFCYQLAAKNIKIPVTVRGSGLDETGADLGNGLVISTEKLNHLLEADRRERLVRVQAGITLKELNTALSVNGLTIPVGGHEMETIGGLISNSPVDDYAGKYGGIMNYVDKIEVVLPNGDILQTNRLGGRALGKKINEKTLEGSLYRKIRELTVNNAQLINDIREKKPGHRGYTNVSRAYYKKTLDIMPLFFGAQGTLGVITEVILRAVPIEHAPKRVVATFENFVDAEKFLDVAKSLQPLRLDIYDIKIIRTAEETGKRLSEITKNMERGVVVYAEYDKRRGKCLNILARERGKLPAQSQLIIESPKTVVTLNEFENSLLSFLNNTRTTERPAVVTDFSIPARHVTSFINDLEVVGKGLGLDLAMYGSYATANYHLRPKFKVEDEDFNKKATAFLRAGAYIIRRQGGSLTGGAPEGRVKAIVTNEEIPGAEKAIYLELKKAFDKYDIMNPAVKLGADARFTLRHFRNEAAKITV
ncbi:FAD-binding oxidoreductase [Candidatus Saccharibacteria bacterium]|nr:FAD-binding oxidoreductase [Candidatus Saccharibacteria bacterium]